MFNSTTLLIVYLFISSFIAVTQQINIINIATSILLGGENNEKSNNYYIYSQKNAF